MESRKALITGATSGIGRATAYQLADEGYSLWLTYSSNSDELRDVAADCIRRGAPVALSSRLDLRDLSSIASLVAEIDREWTSLNVLVNNGGVCPYTPVDDISSDEWDFVLETNARGTFFLTRECVRLLREAPGDRSIINVSSIAGQVGGIQTSIHYAASKAAILAISKSFARRLAPEGVRVNTVTPGPITTPITEQLDPDNRQNLSKQVPLGAFGSPEDVAWIIASLASPKARFVTGATYDVNGGVRID